MISAMKIVKVERRQRDMKLGGEYLVVLVWKVFCSYGFVLLAQVGNNGSHPQYMHSEVDSQIIASTWLDTLNEPGRGCDMGG